MGSTSFKDTYARLQRSDPPAPTPWVRGFTKFQAVARGALLRVVRRRYGAHETPFGVELEKFLPPEHGPLGATPARSPRGTPRQPSRTLAEHRRALAEQRRAAQPPPRTGVGNMGTFAPPRTGNGATSLMQFTNPEGAEGTALKASDCSLPSHKCHTWTVSELRKVFTHAAPSNSTAGSSQFWNATASS